ncbi:MAG: radical SAM protein [Candidatus Micrarchaeota archaeon]|nr:radical SAM protein [Candidatus Micrarchaeota archaeon]
MEKITASLCPECLRIIKARIFERDGKVWISKKCPKHGIFEDLYWGDAESYRKVWKFSHDGKGIKNPNVKIKNPVCPRNCGLCKLHRTHSALGNIVVTNRCDLQCFYCFFYARAMGYVYEPDLEKIREMLRLLKNEKPVGCNAVQLTGGEPTLRDDILDIIRIAKEEGFDHVQLNTNGIRLAIEPGFAKKVREAGVNTVYLSFDGTTPKTNPKNHYEIPYALRNCSRAGLGVVLVPTVLKSVNDHDVGNILKFGLKHIKVVRGVNYQPVSLVGRITKADVRRYRITIPEVIEKISDQTGFVEPEDFYPIPTVTALTHFVEALTNLPKYELTTHPVCGMATYLFKDRRRVIPITRFVDVEGLMEYLDEKAREIKSGKNRLWVTGKILIKLRSFIDREKQPKNINLAKILFNILVRGDYSSLAELHHRTLFVGLMHFMDLWNYDIERVKRCCIHYAQPDGKIVPFCAFNVIPEWYRDKIQEKYSLSIKDWESETGRKLKDDLYRRDVKKLSSGSVYKKAYGL